MAGYVGLRAFATLLWHHHAGCRCHPQKSKLNRPSPIQDDYIQKCLGDRSLLPCVGPR